MNGTNKCLEPPSRAAGRLISFGTSTRNMHRVIEATDNGSDADLILDRPLEVAVANDAAAFPGPYGGFNWAFHRDALALVTRPLALPSGGMGVTAVHYDTTAAQS